MIVIGVGIEQVELYSYEWNEMRERERHGPGVFAFFMRVRACV